MASTPLDGSSEPTSPAIKEDIHRLEALVRNRLDKRMAKFAVKSPEFFTDYTNARKIIDLGTRHDAPAATDVPAKP